MGKKTKKGKTSSVDQVSDTVAVGEQRISFFLLFYSFVQGMTDRDAKFLSKFSLMISKQVYPRCEWTTEQWTKKQTFTCDRCKRTTTCFRISRPLTRPKISHTWPKLEGSFCSFPCMLHRVQCKEAVNKMLKEIYDWRPNQIVPHHGLRTSDVLPERHYFSPQGQSDLSWTEKQRFVCDMCKTMSVSYRLSIPLAIPVTTVHWNKLQNSYCSLSCCQEDTLNLRDSINLAEILPHQTRMFRDMYGYRGAVPPPIYEPFELERFGGKVTESDFAKHLAMPRHGPVDKLPENIILECSYEPRTTVVELFGLPNAESARYRIYRNEEDRKDRVDVNASDETEDDVSSSSSSSSSSAVITTTSMLAPPVAHYVLPEVKANQDRGLEAFYMKEDDDV